MRDKYKAHKIFLGERMELSDVNTFKYLAELGIDVRDEEDYALNMPLGTVT